MLFQQLPMPGLVLLPDSAVAHATHDVLLHIPAQNDNRHNHNQTQGGNATPVRFNMANVDAGNNLGKGGEIPACQQGGKKQFVPGKDEAEK